MTARQLGDWSGRRSKDETGAPVDMYGRPIAVGDKVAKAVSSGRAVNLSVCDVTRVHEGKVYLSGSKVAVVYPARLLIVTHSVPQVTA